jgi:hypothetical protein
LRFEKVTLELNIENGQIFSPTGKISDDKDAGFALTHTFTYVWDKQQKELNPRCDLTSVYNGTALLFDQKNSTNKQIRDAQAQLDFLIPNITQTVCSVSNLFSILNEPFLFLKLSPFVKSNS